MTDEGVNPYEAFEAKIAELLASLPRTEPPPLLITQTARSVRPYLVGMAAAMKSADMIYTRDFPDRFAWLAVQVKRPPVPTAEELAEADKALRTQVLPETSEEELQEAVTGIANDPEKARLAASWADLIEKATGVPGSAPWVVFLLVFCWALKADPDVVNALALALAVFVMMKGTNPGG
jgi:hypothetical protein